MDSRCSWRALPRRSTVGWSTRPDGRSRRGGSSSPRQSGCRRTTQGGFSTWPRSPGPRPRDRRLRPSPGPRRPPRTPGGRAGLDGRRPRRRRPRRAGATTSTARRRRPASSWKPWRKPSGRRACRPAIDPAGGSLPRPADPGRDGRPSIDGRWGDPRRPGDPAHALGPVVGRSRPPWSSGPPSDRPSPAGPAPTRSRTTPPLHHRAPLSVCSRATGREGRPYTGVRPWDLATPASMRSSEKAPEFARPCWPILREVVHDACPEVRETVARVESSRPWGPRDLCGLFGLQGPLHVRLLAARAGDRGGRLPVEGGVGCFRPDHQLSDLPTPRPAQAHGAPRDEAQRGGREGAAPKRAPKKPSTMPPALRAALAKNKKAKAHFDAFSPSRQREYLEWIKGGAKGEDARAA